MSHPVQTGSHAELAALVHSLEVHQAELEVQNHELVATIDELRRSRDELALARDRYHALYDLAPVAVLTIDRGGTIHDVNGAAAAAFGAPREHIVERRLALFVEETGRAAIAECIDALFSTGALHDRPATLEHAAGTAQVRLHGVVLREAGPARAVLAVVDATEVSSADRRELEQRGERIRQDSLTRLAGGIAHAFNNILTVVLAGAQHASDLLGAGSPAAEVLGEVSFAAREAGRLAHQMLAYAGRLSVSARLTDPAVLIRELEPALRAAASTPPLIIELAESPPWLRCDARQIQQLVLALVRNAVEAMVGRPGAVTLTVREAVLSEASIADLALPVPLAPGTYLVLQVRDAGVGMDTDTLARILEPFFSTKFIGRGLGMAVVDGIVRGHRGAMAIESVVDRGTAVSVYFPAFPPPAATATPGKSSGPRPQRGERTVLVVDDDVDMQRLLRRALTHLGFTVVVAADGLEAVERFQTEPLRFDAVLLDLQMPRMNGITAGAAIHALRPEVPLALITGFGDIPADTSNVFTATLAKPFDVAELRAVLASLLTLPR